MKKITALFLTALVCAGGAFAALPQVEVGIGYEFAPYSVGKEFETWNPLHGIDLHVGANLGGPSLGVLGLAVNLGIDFTDQMTWYGPLPYLEPSSGRNSYLRFKQTREAEWLFSWDEGATVFKLNMDAGFTYKISLGMFSVIPSVGVSLNMLSASQDLLQQPEDVKKKNGWVVEGDAGPTGNGKNVIYYSETGGYYDSIQADFFDTSYGLIVGLGLRAKINPLCWVEVGASAACDFFSTYSGTVTLKDTTGYKANGEYYEDHEYAKYTGDFISGMSFHFRSPYVLIGFTI
ncbi:MAG: hypothetical protein LBR23_01930 [Spirochaetaceae bacterium]|jgi:hypothetical protein|nr:hypothetical protein [Spirochaetaceae bacterium]